MRSQSMNKMRCLHWYRFCSELENIEILTLSRDMLPRENFNIHSLSYFLE